MIFLLMFLNSLVFAFQNPAEKITGAHCECRNFGCDNHDGKECGGLCV